MVEKDKLFSSKIKFKGIFIFEDFYRFCYDWLMDETAILLSEDKYSEKIQQDGKLIEIIWTGYRNVTDYFRFEVRVEFRIIGMTDVEVTEGGKKLKMNKGTIEMKIQGILARDYKGKFEKNAAQKFLRGTYEKWVIPARVEQFEERIIKDCDEFLSQAKAYLDLEGKR